MNVEKKSVGTPIEELGFSRRTTNVLMYYHEIKRLNGLIHLIETLGYQKMLTQVKYLGWVSIHEIMSKMVEIGYGEDFPTVTLKSKGNVQMLAETKYPIEDREEIVKRCLEIDQLAKEKTDLTVYFISSDRLTFRLGWNAMYWTSLAENERYCMVKYGNLFMTQEEVDAAVKRAIG